VICGADLVNPGFDYCTFDGRHIKHKSKQFFHLRSRVQPEVLISQSKCGGLLTLLHYHLVERGHNTTLDAKKLIPILSKVCERCVWHKHITTGHPETKKTRENIDWVSTNVDNLIGRKWVSIFWQEWVMCFGYPHVVFTVVTFSNSGFQNLMTLIHQERHVRPCHDTCALLKKATKESVARSRETSKGNIVTLQTFISVKESVLVFAQVGELGQAAKISA
jgi:hypothetical protein